MTLQTFLRLARLKHLNLGLNFQMVHSVYVFPCFYWSFLKHLMRTLINVIRPLQRASLQGGHPEIDMLRSPCHQDDGDGGGWLGQV